MFRSVNTKNSRRTREKPLVPRVFSYINYLNQSTNPADTRAFSRPTSKAKETRPGEDEVATPTDAQSP